MKKKTKSRKSKSRSTKRRSSGTSKHKRVRITCHKCGRVNSTKAHRFHGVGSYARTH